MTQQEQVAEAMRNHGGYATFLELNQLVNTSSWKTKTPYASIRRIVQEGPFFKIHPGLWALKDFKDEVLHKFDIEDKTSANYEIFTHTYYQGLLVQMGNINGFSTYVPPQDKNRKFLETPLHELTTIDSIYTFGYENILKRAKTVDVIWFNKRQMPYSLFEVEHSTDIQNSLLKFYDLQDYYAKFYIVADDDRKRQFQDIISRSIYAPIQKRVEFLSYSSLPSNKEINAIANAPH
jgi:hypothetical protein